jgi:phosphatidylglycerophosphate synthase
MPTLLRQNNGLLQPLERPALQWLVVRMPPWATPDRLTFAGFIGAVIVMGAYALAAYDLAWLWIASLGFIINWFGDSLDGTVARHRRMERPRYGFFLDSLVDVLEQFLLTIGLGLSGLIRWDLSFFAFSVFLMMSILSFVRASVSNIYRLTYGGMGLTEIRVVFILLNTMIYFFPPDTFSGLVLPMTYPNMISVIWSSALLMTFVVSMLAQLREVAAEDPPPVRRSPPRRGSGR